MTVLFFGERWAAPQVDEAYLVEQADPRALHDRLAEATFKAHLDRDHDQLGGHGSAPDA